MKPYACVPLLARFGGQPAGGEIVGVEGERSRGIETGEEQTLRLDVVLVRPMKVRVLARRDRREQPAVEPQAR